MFFHICFIDDQRRLSPFAATNKTFMQNIYIRKIPSWLITLNIIPDNICFALAPYIFLNKNRYEEFINNEQTAYTKAIIAHESVHVMRQSEMGLLKFILLYTFSRKFCLNEELIAIQEEMRIYKQHNKTYDTDRCARFLSSFWMYHKCTNYITAKKLLDAMWH